MIIIRQVLVKAASDEDLERADRNFEKREKESMILQQYDDNDWVFEIKHDIYSKK